MTGVLRAIVAALVSLACLAPRFATAEPGDAPAVLEAQLATFQTAMIANATLHGVQPFLAMQGKLELTRGRAIMAGVAAAGYGTAAGLLFGRNAHVRTGGELTFMALSAAGAGAVVGTLATCTPVDPDQVLAPRARGAGGCAGYAMDAMNAAILGFQAYSWAIAIRDMRSRDAAGAARIVVPLLGLGTGATFAVLQSRRARR